MEFIKDAESQAASDLEGRKRKFRMARIKASFEDPDFGELEPEEKYYIKSYQVIITKETKDLKEKILKFLQNRKRENKDTDFDDILDSLWLWGADLELFEISEESIIILLSELEDEEKIYYVEGGSYYGINWQESKNNE